MARPIMKIKQAFYLSEYQYWAIQYLITMNPNRNVSEIIEEAIKFSVHHLNNHDEPPRKMAVPEKGIKQYAYVTRETHRAWGLVKYNRGLHGWGMTDIARYGLRHTLSIYKERYPDLRKIKEKYGNKETDIKELS